MSANGAAPRSDADLEELRVALVKLHSEGAPFRVFHGACAISELMMARNHAREEVEDLRKAKEGVEILLCDAQAEVDELKWKLDLAYAALRPFVDAYLAAVKRTGDPDTVPACRPAHFARLAEIVPEKKT